MQSEQSQQRTLDFSLNDNNGEPKGITLQSRTEQKPKAITLPPNGRNILKSKLAELTTEVTDLGPSLLLSATYDGERRVAILKFYEPTKNRFYLWSDKSGHKPHCFSKQSPADLAYLKKERPNIIDIVPVKKHDLIADSEITVSKIIATDPLAIGGQDNSLRNAIPAWEADIKYYENFLYDSELYVGAFYQIKNGKIEPVPFDTPQEVKDSFKRTLESSKPEIAKEIAVWASLLNQPLPRLKRAALDIEVLSPENRVPNADEANYPVVAASIVSDDLQRLYILERKDLDLGKNTLPKEAEVLFFSSEGDLLTKLFTDMLDYPFLATFNGDDFDLNYLYHRSQKPEFDLTKEEIPIVMGNNFSGLKYGIHIDLYKTFNNRSLQIYAFGNKYSDHTLNGVAEGLLNESKVSFDGMIGDLPAYDLANYNLQDTLLTYKLVSIYNDVLLKLLVVIARVGKMPIDDLSRLGVSNWIRSMLYFAHRKQNALIPRPEELKEKGGAKSEAIIKGKKYKGGLVIEPTTGVHFNVSVLDFASLYPSIIKVFNISYETVNCPHPECRTNLIPEVGHWACTKRRGIESLVVGSLRDLRVDYYKQLTKSKTLSKEDKELYKVVSQGLKVILNASYGVLGFESFPLYCLPAAEAVATLGRYAITRTIAKCKELGIEVIYSDTDSLFLKAPSEEQIAQVSAWTQKELGIELDVDKVYRYVAMSERKKNYFGVLQDGTVDLKGLTGKKSQTPQFIKDSFYEILDSLSRVKTEQDFAVAREEIKKRLKTDYQRLKQKEISMDDLAFNVMIGKDISGYRDNIPQHVRAAQLLQKAGREIKAGDIISFVKTTTGDGAKPASLTRKDEIDVEKYLEYMKSTFDQILGSLGYDFDEILGATKLEDFFWGQ
ncbi:MAG TPA: DNA-directed DNA polymerase I [Nitrososphaerales archaeon]|nr:DNA-directed DNA polymerase I [Nitrososphaerales archaeon]